MKPQIFEIKKGTDILAYGCVFSESGKCIMEWTGKNQLLMVWPSFNEMKLVVDIMKATINFLA
jgi:hypothetical protein